MQSFSVISVNIAIYHILLENGFLSQHLCDNVNEGSEWQTFGRK